MCGTHKSSVKYMCGFNYETKNEETFQDTYFLPGRNSNMAVNKLIEYEM